MQETTIAALQNEVAKLKHTVATLKVENHVLRVKNGQVQQGVTQGRGTPVHGGDADETPVGATVPVDRVMRSLEAWGEAAAMAARGAVFGDDVTGDPCDSTNSGDALLHFCHDMMVWSVQRWIGGRSGGDLVLEAPGCVLLEAVERDHVWCAERLDVIVAFIESTLGVEVLRGAHEEIVELALRRWCDGREQNTTTDLALPDNAEWDALYSDFLTKMVASDGIRGELLMPSASHLCLERLQRLIDDVLFLSPETPPMISAPHTVSFDSHTLLDLIWVCDACISRLAARALPVTVSETVLRDVAGSVIDIAQKCEVVAGLLPNVALAGKRLQCQLIAALQRMEALNKDD